MLPDALFKPLDLQHVIEDVERLDGAHGVVDLLVAALTDRRIKRDSGIDAHLDVLKLACRQTRRYKEIIPVLRRIAVLNPARRPEVAAELALVHGHLKERAKGVAMLEAAFAEQLRLPARRRSAGFCVVAEIAAAVLGKPALAREIAAMGRAREAATLGRALVPGTVGDLAQPLFSLDELAPRKATRLKATSLKTTELKTTELKTTELKTTELKAPVDAASRDTGRERDHHIELHVERQLDRDTGRALDRDIERELARDIERELARDIERELARDIEREVARPAARDGDLDLDRGSDRGLDHGLDRGLDLDRTAASGRPRLELVHSAAA
jgi:hypothetical protein